MKDRRLAMGVLVMLVGVGEVSAEEIKPYFDMLHADPSMAISKRDATSTSAPIAIPIPREPKALQASPVKISELLKDVPLADRIEFIGDLTLLDGEFVSANLAPLQKTLSQDQIDRILSSLSAPPASEPPAKASRRKKKRHLTSISKLVQDAPPSVRNEFYESLVFRRGEVVSFYIGGLETALKRTSVDVLLAALNPEPEVDSKSLCGNGWCADSYCDLPPDPKDDPACLARDKWTCKSNCK